jgi:hypothetical protein
MGRRKRNWLRRLKRPQVERAIFLDFEGTADPAEPPVLVGVLIGGAGTQVTQYLLDRSLDPLRALTPQIKVWSLGEVVDYLIDLSDKEGRHIVSWSLFDRRMIEKWTAPRRAFRYRSAIPTAKKWRRGRSTLGEGCRDVSFKGQRLQAYLDLIGYPVPAESRKGAAKWIRTARKRLRSAEGEVARLSPGGRQAWLNLVDHNLHDVLGLRAVVRVATGLDQAPCLEASSL